MSAWLVLLMVAAAAEGQVVTDDFDAYPDHSLGAPAWEAESVDFEMVDGAYRGETGRSLWQAVPYAAVVTVAVELTVDKVTGRPEDWKVAGLQLVADGSNHWGLHLVVSPEAAGARHYVELQEMLDGTWLASSQEGTRLPVLEQSGNTFDWQLGHTYRLELALTVERITGRVLDGDQEVARIAYDLRGNTKAVRMGRPALRADNLVARFDHAAAAVERIAQEPVVERAVTPWVSRDAPQLAQGTGYFATAQVDGRWWLVDPEGKAYFDVGTDHCNYNAHWCEALGYAPYHRNVEAKFGSAEAWAVSATDRLKAWGFNTLAAGASPETYHKGLPHLLFASFGSGFARVDWICEPIHWTGFPNVFSPKWPAHCAIVARRIAEQNRNDPWCIGTFLDNELEWYGKQGYLVDEIFKLPADHSAKQALWQWLDQHFRGAAGVNRALGTSYADGAAFLVATDVPAPSDALSRVRDDFLGVIAEEYFRVACTALREADPEHLVMGCRFAGRAPEPALAPAGRYNDVFTINTYPRVDLQRGIVQGVPRQFTDDYAVVDKPFIITEWSFPALDSGLPCQHGAGMRVDTQAQKARCYQVFAEAMADLPFVVGYHYFMWADEPAQGISSTFPEDSNYGLVNVNDETYTVLTEMATKVNGAVFERHGRSAPGGDLELAAGEGGFVVRNPGGSRAEGLLSWGRAGRLETAQVRLDAGTEQVRPWPGDGVAVALLRRWDGSLERLVHAPPGAGSAVANLGAEPIQGVPVAIDGETPAAALLDRLEPGQMAALTTDWGAEEQPAELVCAGPQVTWTCRRADGSLFDSVAAGGDKLELGRLVFALHQRIRGQDMWVETNRIEELRVRRAQGLTWLDAVVARAPTGQVVTAVDDAGQQAAARTGEAGFRAGVRAVVFADAGVVMVKPLWVESTDEREWELVDVFWFCRPAIGGSPANDAKGGPDVPNYYLPAQFWTDSALGGAFGALCAGDDWNISFWQDPGGGYHPDARREVNLTMKPKQRWEASDWPWLWVYGRRDADARDELVALSQSLADLVVVGR